MLYQVKFNSELDQLLCLCDICSKFDGWDNVYFLYTEDKKVPNIISKFYRTRFFNINEDNTDSLKTIMDFYSFYNRENPALIFTNNLEDHSSFIRKLKDNSSTEDTNNTHFCVDLYNYGKTLPDDSRGHKEFYKTLMSLVNNDSVDFIIYSDNDVPNNQKILPQNNYFILTNKEHLKEKILNFIKNNSKMETLNSNEEIS